MLLRAVVLWFFLIFWLLMRTSASNNLQVSLDKVQSLLQFTIGNIFEIAKGGVSFNIDERTLG